MRGMLNRLFGGGIDPEAVAPAPVTAFVFSYAQFGSKVSLRVLYSPHPKHLNDAALVYRARQTCGELQRRSGTGGSAPWDGGHHRFVALCVRLPRTLVGPVPVWVRDFFVRHSDLPPDFDETEGFYPLWLVDDGGPVGRFVERPAATPRARANQLIQAARRAGGRPVRAALIQANAALFAPGAADNPCLVAFTFDDRMSDERLADVAARVFDLKGTHQDDPDLAFTAGLTTDERFIYYERARLPRQVTGGPEVFAGHLYVHRPFLPDGYFSGERLMTCLAVPGDRGALELLPEDADD